MLPAGLSAQPVDAAGIAAARRLLPGAQTVAALLVGACSCDLVRDREAVARDDERHLRSRLGALRVPRDEIIRRLERHRRRSGPPTAEPWAPRLAAFVAEHARNAGPTLYALGFGDGPPPMRGDPPPLSRTVAEVRERPGGWLEEARPVLVVR
jgi:hypothetical protein